MRRLAHARLRRPRRWSGGRPSRQLFIIVPLTPRLVTDARPLRVEPVTVAPVSYKLDTVAVPDLDFDLLGHSAFAGDAVLQDIFDLIEHGSAPADRQRLTRRNDPVGPYWAFRA